MGVFKMWNNHRGRQAGKYAKVMAQSAYPQPVYQPMPGYAPAGPAPAAPAVIHQAGRQVGYREGWQAGQRDLVRAILAGELTWDDAVRRLR